MTTACRTNRQRRTYRSNAFTTTCVTVVPSAFALSTACRHKGSGMRSERGMVAMSGGDREATLDREALGRRVVPAWPNDDEETNE